MGSVTAVAVLSLLCSGGSAVLFPFHYLAKRSELFQEYAFMLLFLDSPAPWSRLLAIVSAMEI